jgi:predicted DNA-binding protein
VRVPARTKRRLARAAKVRRLPPSYLVREAVERAFEEEDRALRERKEAA